MPTNPQLRRSPWQQAARMEGGAAWGPLAEHAPGGWGTRPSSAPAPCGLCLCQQEQAGEGPPGRGQACGRGWVPAGLTRGPGVGGLPASGRGEARTRPQPHSCPSVSPFADADGCRCSCLLRPRLLLLSVCSWGDHLSCEAWPVSAILVLGHFPRVTRI